MAKKKPNMHSKPDALDMDPRANMYRGKDRVTTSEEQDITETEDPSVEASMEATPEVTGFMDSKNSNQESNDGIMGGETEIQYKKRYDDLKTYYDKKLSEWKQEKETLEAQSKVAERQIQYAPPKSAEELEQFKEQFPDVYCISVSPPMISSFDSWFEFFESIKLSTSGVASIVASMLVSSVSSVASSSVSTLSFPLYISIRGSLSSTVALLCASVFLCFAIVLFSFCFGCVDLI